MWHVSLGSDASTSAFCKAHSSAAGVLVILFSAGCSHRIDVTWCHALQRTFWWSQEFQRLSLFPLPKIPKWWPCIHWTTWGSGSSRGALIGSKPQRTLKRRRLSCDFSCCFFWKLKLSLFVFYLLDGIAVFHTEGAWSSRTLATLLFTCSFRSRVSTICDSCNSCKQPKKETVSIFWVILSGCFPSPGHLKG